MTDRPLDLRGALTRLRHFKRLLCVAIVVGLLGGGAYAVIKPTLPTSTAVVLLPPSPVSATGVPVRDMDTEIRIATGQENLRAAGREMQPAESVGQVRRRVNVTAPTTEILSIRAEASSVAQAEKLADDIATGYIAYTNAAGSVTANALITSLQKQSDGLDLQIAKLQSETTATLARLSNEDKGSASGQRDAQLLDSLRAEQTSAALQKSSLETQITTARSQNGTTSAGARLFQRASNARRGSQIVHILTYAGLGGLAAFVIIVMIVLLLRRRDRRLWLRDEIADAMGAPVLASIGAEQIKSVKSAQRLLSDYRPTVGDVWGMRKAFHELGLFEHSEKGTSGLLIVALRDDAAAVSAGAQLALFLQTLGVTTTLNVPECDGAAELVRTALAMSIDGPLAGAGATRDAGARSAAEPRFDVTLAPVDRQAPELAVPEPWPRTVLAVSAGIATTDDLARVAMMAIDLGYRIDGVVVVNPDSADRTAGGAPGAGRSVHRNTPSRLSGATGGGR